MDFNIKMRFNLVHIKTLSLLFFLTLGMNLIFLYYYNAYYYYSITQLHGQVGYNINNYNSAHLNPNLTNYMDKQKTEAGHLIDFDHVNPTEFDPPAQPFIINDTIGYGVVLGMLWKFNRSI